MAMGQLGQGVKAQCKVCNGYSAADQFKLHFQLKQMVCPGCYTGKTSFKGLKNEEVKKEPEQPPRPPGWDKEDDYLDKVSRMRKEQSQGYFSRIPNSEQVKCNCPSCKYVYKYDPIKRMPAACPYCNGPVPRYRASDVMWKFNILVLFTVFYD